MCFYIYVCVCVVNLVSEASRKNEKKFPIRRKVSKIIEFSSIFSFNNKKKITIFVFLLLFRFVYTLTFLFLHIIIVPFPMFIPKKMCEKCPCHYVFKFANIQKWFRIVSVYVWVCVLCVCAR